MRRRPTTAGSSTTRSFGLKTYLLAPDSAERACLDLVRRSDCVLVVMGARYGATTSRELSPSHQEYREAVALNKDVLAFVQDRIDAEPPQREFIKEVREWATGRSVPTFKTPEQLRDQVIRALRDLELSRASSITITSAPLGIGREPIEPSRSRWCVECTLPTVTDSMLRQRSRGMAVAVVAVLLVVAVAGVLALRGGREPQATAVASPSPPAAALPSASASAPASPSPTATPGPASGSVTPESPILGYRVTLPEAYRRSRAIVVTAPGDTLGVDLYTTQTEREAREACLQDAGHLQPMRESPDIRVGASRNPRGISAYEWATTPQAPGAQPLSTHQRVEAATIGGLEAVRLVQDNATAATTAFVVRARDRMYEIYPTQSSSQLPKTWLDEIAKTFVVIEPQPFPSATPTVAPRVAAREAGEALARPFAARDASAVARLMPECWFAVSYAIDGTVPGQGPLNRSVSQFTQALRDRFAAGDLTVTVDPALQVTTQGGDDRFFVRSDWREPDRTIRVDLVLDERDGRWLWTSALHQYTAADRGCIPYRSPWVAAGRSC